ncbi:hypothetical protein DL764_007224 [Monosporascus ibericus]|uniref:CCHC-type domain-containing protein n=1 Tax=Monosporascus ibericus TaxID=155417 RepID=A0A4V1X9U6_9PEZI|nr:hypothetical protein DL764_007224 [Monosporascus ibericus]
MALRLATWAVFAISALAQETSIRDDRTTATHSTITLREHGTPTGSYQSFTSQITLGTSLGSIPDGSSSIATENATRTESSEEVVTIVTTKTSITWLTGSPKTSKPTTTLPSNFTSSSTTSTAPSVTNTQPCNNYPEFCQRRYSNITEVGCHNSPFITPNNLAANQKYDVTAQLNDGVRFLQAQIQWPSNDTEPHFCHTSCDILDAGPITEWLTEVKNWVATHPYDVVTILLGNGNYSVPSMYAPYIEKSGILRYIYQPPVVPMTLKDWPTLNDMILKGQRVVMFLDYMADQRQYPWLLDEFSQMWETPFDPVDQSFPCTVQRPPDLPEDAAKNRLYLLNHNLNIDLSLLGAELLVPARAELNLTNNATGYGSLGAGADNCLDRWVLPPKILNVDYYDAGEYPGFRAYFTMTSSVYFKFKSQKEPSRVEFDGTGISVFELKRDIIIKSGLGDGTDFDLAIYSEDNTEEYDDDTTIIPRSTTVIARRLPASKPGAGRAARYVSGKMPASAKNSSRRENTAKAVKPATTGLTQMSAALTEEERMMAMFQAQSDQWNAQQEEMSHQAAVYKPGAKKPANVPDHEPPVGYVCYRCGQKGHWIQVCPTNDNPEFDNRPRVKRTTGIPRSFLKTVDKSALQQSGVDGEDVKPPAGIMVNADGDFVIAEPDKASWEQFQAKTKSSAATQKVAAAEDKELEEKGLMCSVDKRMFIEPMKTPCCEKTYCNECITNSLIESDFVCPGCGTEGVLIDDLKPDEETSTKIQDYLKDKEVAKTKDRSQSPPSVRAAKSPSEDPNERKETIPGTEPTTKSPSAAPEKAKSPTTAPEKTKSPSPTSAAVKSPATEEAKKPGASVLPTTNGTPKPQEAALKKRPADELLENPKIPKAPKAMQRAQEAKNMQNMMQQGMGGMGMMPGMMPFPMNNMNSFGQPNMNQMMNPMMMGMNPMMNPMMGMNGFNPAGFPNMNGFGNFGGMNGGMNGGGMANMNGGGPNGFNKNNQQQPYRSNFTPQNNEDDAYFRKPVNPGRHQNKQRRVRPSDYREL